MKKDIFSSTKRNITAISMVVVFLCLIVFSIITQVFYSSKVLDNVDHQILEQKKFLSGDIFEQKNGYSTDINTHVPENFRRKQDGKFMRIPPNLIVIIYKNEVLESMSSNLYFSEDNLPAFPSNSEDKIVTLENNGYTFRGIDTVNGDYRLQILTNINAEMTSIKKVRTAIIFSLIALIIVALFLSAYLASRVIKPIKEAYEKQVYFVQDASHEMRTPLAVIKGKLELLAHEHGGTIDDHFEHISKMMSEVRGLEKLNSDLLLLSKEDLHLDMNITKFSLDNFIEDISEFYMDLAEIKDKKFRVLKPRKGIEVEWEYNKIKRAIIILLENAFKYTNDDGEITLDVEEINKNIKISVRDNGIGIKKEEQKRVFDRFYRSEKVRGENISGTGIGLSLLKSMSKNFGIKLKVTSEYGVGSEFSLIIPKVIK